jgi:hypothetical protein
MLLLILWSCSLVKLKNQLSPLILVLDSRCRIRLDNLELKRIFKDSSFFLGSPPFSYGLKIFSRGSSKGLFFVFVFNMTIMYFLHFETLQMKWVLFFLKFLLCNVHWSCLSYLLFWLPTLEMLQSYLLLSKFFSLKNVIGYLPNYFPPIL